MVSSPHEAMHRIFQEYPGLFSGLSEVLGVTFPAPSAVAVLPTDLTEARPVERRVDTLLRFDGPDGGSFLLAVEAQGRKDPAKPASWAYYASYLHTKYSLPPLLLVVCQDRATAEWAARPVRIGPPQWATLMLHPLVAGPHNMPVITDPAEVRKDFALATLAAITHAANPDVGAILKAMSTALRDTPPTISDPIVEFIAQGLGKLPASEQWRTLVAVDLSFYKSPLSEEIRDAGRAEGRAEDIVLILEDRGLEVSDAARERITGCKDPALLRHWLRRALSATSTEDIFTESHPGG
ncbi:MULTISPECIES: hypothetical protein [Streptomyces]|uniref:Transposase (putative) YhgA-like domain-containing protein n=1 Tax=Streptomyces lycii TaxID=2654337 RepID=A0ABQ7FP50_9ACTN|nr:MULTISPECIES: hypothetical protein [Streptomyces]KAF4410455.1 hypothetical protein GCU69_03930 [Streptomyces lycii]PGH49825.1 hypothetical protein CRI70_15405 [Streptomyces sp. Ru87]